MKYFLFLLPTLLSFQLAFSCSMISFVDASGKTWVGNNEDYMDPDTWIWTLPKGKHAYGAVYFGYGNFFAQGGMNEAGLVFDGFAMEPKEVRNLKGKKKTNPAKLVNEIMHSCATVAQVQEVLQKFKLDFLQNAQLMFVDKTGASLIVEGDAILIKPANQYRICTNFYQSTISSHQAITCDRYLSGYELMEKTEIDQRGKDLCIAALDSMHQEGGWGGTQYSNVYDPQEGWIYLYLFYNFEEEVRLSVKDVLGDLNEPKQLREYFKQTDRYERFREQYELADSLTQTLGESSSPEALKASLAQLDPAGPIQAFAGRLFEGMEAFLTSEQWTMASELGLFCQSVFPQSWKIQAILAKALMEQGMREEAEAHIDQALALKPGDPELLKAKEKIQNR